jgi:hypothetical protein
LSETTEKRKKAKWCNIGIGVGDVGVHVGTFVNLDYAEFVLERRLSKGSCQV